jgi:hypothetical protein
MHAPKAASKRNDQAVAVTKAECGVLLRALFGREAFKRDFR